MKALGCHTYAGGLASGVAEHFDLIGLCEHDGYGDKVKALNFPDVPRYSTFDKWPRHFKRAERPEFVFANPPCAPFSQAASGRKTPWHQDARLQFFKDIFNLLPDIAPDVMAVESVTQAWTKAEVMFYELAEQAAGWGYSTSVIMHNAKHYGVSQHRNRLFAVFHKVDVEFDEPDFDQAPVLGQVLKKVKIPAATKKRYAKDVQLAPNMDRLYDQVEPGKSFRECFDRVNGDNIERNHLGGIKGRPGFLNRKLNAKAVGPVIIGGNTLIHPTEPRALYPEELSALVGFPDGWRWPDNIPLNALADFAARGVSPKVGEWLARSAKQSIEKGKRLNRQTMRMIDWRKTLMTPQELRTY
jgi:site-specific DNA-cytosine methylase